MMKSIAFVCVHNSCRSQMAEGFSKELGKGIIEVHSAGTEKYHEVKPLAVQVMKEIGIDISKQYPKLLVDIPKIDILITMGCGVQCPFIECDYNEDWGLKDPSGGTIEDFRKSRDVIKSKVTELIEKIRKDSFK